MAVCVSVCVCVCVCVACVVRLAMCEWCGVFHTVTRGSLHVLVVTCHFGVEMDQRPIMDQSCCAVVIFRSIG